MRLVLLLLLGAHLVYAGTHSLRYFYTGVSGISDFPEFTAVGLVDDEPFTYFDSNTKRTVPKTEWIRQNEGADYWDRVTQTFTGTHPTFKAGVQILKDRFNQTAGVHTWQLMYGCELDEDGSTRGYYQYGYDGDDFVSLDKSTLTWTAANPQAVITKIKWETKEKQFAEYWKGYLEKTCIEWVQKYVGYGKDTLERKVSPQVSLLQKSSSSSVKCHATGFYPKEVTISWQKNKQDHDEDVDLGELLPNEDGTFQKTSTLRVSPDELKKNEFSCVVEHQGKTIREILTDDSLPIGMGRDRTFQKISTLRVSPDELKKNEFSCVVEHQGKTIREILTHGTHSLRYVYTAVSGNIDFPEYTAVGLVDDEQFIYFDSSTKKTVPKTEWIRQNVGADYWDRETQIGISHHQLFKVNIQTLTQRFNQSAGVHTVQVMYGCEVDDDGTKRGYMQYGYDGEDFISLDTSTLTWIAASPQAMITKYKWEANRAIAEQQKAYLENECIEWLQKYVGYGKDTLQRKVSPQVSLLQKSSSSSVTCHATGFYPKEITISWQKNRQDLYEDVDLGERLPNEDGTFQKISTLRVSPDELKKNEYSCVVEHQGKTIREILTHDF